jgi:hypothetical protein
MRKREGEDVRVIVDHKLSMKKKIETSLNNYYLWCPCHTGDSIV